MRSLADVCVSSLKIFGSCGSRVLAKIESRGVIRLFFGQQSHVLHAVGRIRPDALDGPTDRAFKASNNTVFNHSYKWLHLLVSLVR